MKLHNRLLSFIGVTLQWLGGLYAFNVYGWQSLLPYIALLFVFTYFVGTPAIVNIFRRIKAYQGRISHLIISLIMQCIFVVLMVFLLGLADMQAMIAFFISLGIIRAFSMPSDQLMQERIGINVAEVARQSRDQDTV